MPTVYVNDKPVEIGNRKLNCIQAAELAGVFIPSYCWHEALTVVASCRMCLVEVGDVNPKDGTLTMQGKVLPGCQTPVRDGTTIVTGEYDKRDTSFPARPYDAGYLKAGPPGTRAKKAQADTLEGLLINHPLDCPVCDKAGECKLQDYSYKYGRSESRMVDEKNTPPNKPELSSKITLFTDRCIMCTRCVRFTREISGTAELMVTNRGHHEEIDVFPGYPLENKLAGNVVDLCPVGALGSKDFLYKQRVWYLKESEGVCSRCSTGCSIHVDSNKDIVYRLRARTNLEAQGYFICDEGRYGFHFANSTERVLRPMVTSSTGKENPPPALTTSVNATSPSRGEVKGSTSPLEGEVAASEALRRVGGGNLKPTPWNVVTPQLKHAFSKAAAENASGVLAVLSPFLTVEEAFLYATYFKGLSPDVRLALGPVPVIGQDDKYPKDVKGNPVEPTKFVIRAEKCPNRRGVEAVLKHFQGSVIAFADAMKEPVSAMWFAGGYPDPLDIAKPQAALLVVQDLFPSQLSEGATFVLPATSNFEKEGTFVNHAGLAQTFARAVRPPVEVRTELQLAFDLLGRRGLVQGNAIRAELAKAIPFFAGLAAKELPTTGVRFELPTV